MTTAMDGHLPSLGWSPTNPRMVTHQKEVYYKLGIWHLDLNQKLKPGDNYQGWSPTIPRMVTRHKEVYYKLVIWHLDLTHKTKAR